MNRSMLIGGAFAIAFAIAGYADNDGKGFNVNPQTFDPTNTNMVSANWLGGLGCVTQGHIQVFLPPDFSTTQIQPFADTTCPTGDSQDNQNEGLLLAKTGPTNNNAAASAKIDGINRLVISELGWDVRNGTHCGAGRRGSIFTSKMNRRAPYTS